MINYINKGKWLNNAILDAGIGIFEDATLGWVVSDPIAAQVIIDSFDPLPFAKDEKIEELKAEGARRAALVYSFVGDDPRAWYNFMGDIITMVKPAARDPMPQRLLNFKQVRDVVIAAVAEINAMTDWQVVASYDVVNTPVW